MSFDVFMAKKSKTSITSYATPVDEEGEEIKQKQEELDQVKEKEVKEEVEDEDLSKSIFELADIDEDEDGEITEKKDEVIDKSQKDKKDKPGLLDKFKIKKEKPDVEKEKSKFSNEDKEDKKTKKVGWNVNLDKYLIEMSRVTLRDKIFFTKNLGVMVKAGLSLGQSLSALAEQTPNKKFRKVLSQVEQDVRKGISFADSLKKHPKIFNHLFVSMISSGEKSGSMENVLEQLHKQMKRDHALISKVRGAMIYPVIIIMAMIGIGSAMIVFVVPKFVTIFNEVNTELPLATRILIKISEIVNNNSLIVALILIMLLTIFFRFIKTKKGKAALHRFFLVMPITSTITKKVNLARFSRTMSSMLKTDIPIVDAFKTTAEVVGNVHYKKILFEAAEQVKKGVHLHDILKKKAKLFPATVTQMISVGEESGSIDAILDEIANFYEEDVDQTMKNLPTIIEPLLILILGLGVAGMAMAILMPMYSLSQAI